MPAWVLFPTFDQTVKQYGLHNLAPLIMLQVELSIKICDTSCSCLPLYCLYDIPSMWPQPGDCTYLPICLHKDEEKEEKEDCWDKLLIQGR